jgi:hypothetical protein
MVHQDKTLQFIISTYFTYYCGIVAQAVFKIAIVTLNTVVASREGFWGL